MNNGLVILGFTLLIIFLITFVPLLIIWSLNTLFHLDIEVTFYTWLAALILTSTFTLRSK